MKKYAKKIFLKHMPDTYLEQTTLSLNSVSTKFLCKQSLDNYLLEILIELGEER